MAKPITLWVRIRDSLWLLPSICTFSAIALAFVTVWIDRNHAPRFMDSFWFVFQTGAEGARGVLSTIAGSIMTVTGVVFSITIVVLQLASSQFTPRVLRTFTEDRANHIVLGVFIGTFTYSLLVMRSVRSSSDDYGRFVPALSVTVAVLLALMSIGFLIFFVHHVAHSIRVEIIMQRVTNDAFEVVDQLFPESVAEPAPAPSAEEWRSGDDQVVLITAWRGGYIQSFNDEALLADDDEPGYTVVMKRAVGDFVVEGDVLAHAWPPRDGRTVEAVTKAFAIGAERTRNEDVERGIIELADIGIRALSPSLNDPSTAIVCIDRMTELITRLGTRSFPTDQRISDNGKIRIQTKSRPWDELVRLAYRELRHHGSGDPAVALRLVASLGRVAARVPESRRAPLITELHDVVSAAEKRLSSPHDVERVVRSAAKALDLINAQTPAG